MHIAFRSLHWSMSRRADTSASDFGHDNRTPCSAVQNDDEVALSLTLFLIQQMFRLYTSDMATVLLVSNSSQTLHRWGDVRAKKEKRKQTVT